jgi:hypothetical protein
MINRRVEIPPYARQRQEGERYGLALERKTLVSGPNAGREAVVVLLDSGAHRTYVAADCRWL